MERNRWRNSWLRLLIMLGSGLVVFPFVLPVWAIVQREPIYPESHDSLVAVGMTALPDTGAASIRISSQPFGTDQASLSIAVSADERDPLQANPTVVLAGPVSRALGMCSGSGANTPVNKSFGELTRVSKAAVMQHYQVVISQERMLSGRSAWSSDEVDKRVMSERYMEFALETHLDDYETTDAKGVKTRVQRQSVNTQCEIRREGLWEPNGPEARLSVPRMIILTPQANPNEITFSSAATIALTSGVVLIGQSEPPTRATSTEVQWSDVTGEVPIFSEDFAYREKSSTSAIFRDGRLAQKDQTVTFVGGIALGILGSIVVTAIPMTYDAAILSVERYIRARRKAHERPKEDAIGGDDATDTRDE